VPITGLTEFEDPLRCGPANDVARSNRIPSHDGNSTIVRRNLYFPQDSLLDEKKGWSRSPESPSCTPSIAPIGAGSYA
jgi:hypothetical protein